MFHIVNCCCFNSSHSTPLPAGAEQNSARQTPGPPHLSLPVHLDLEAAAADPSLGDALALVVVCSSSSTVVVVVAFQLQFLPCPQH